MTSNSNKLFNLEEHKNCHYGLLNYDSVNIGDEIQSIAAKKFLPKVDTFVNREKLKDFSSEIKVKMGICMILQTGLPLLVFYR